ncbi:valine--tRNA ligase [Halococcus salifodinae]|uniref:Valine--tRNA ligase n=1 Tax=Halococcus salifodinae DSM 8989 TaxID=1227456 RepID=M0NEX8_9EURY|nr:valine--tRNA ligase [Halococcus salifodinae]EMA55649.1 valyl-tRNA ligase [Halococcus salifodinae DSM 8989]
MTELAETYDPDALEAKWREEWHASDLYHDDDHDDSATEYVIDTPPPYPTGDLHIGHALGWSYMDFAARYHRMQGKNVSFPQGWDCHGLPTEVKVEENHDIRRTDVPREEFRELCVEHTERKIDGMKETMQWLGFSQDWSQEYRTMDSDYWGKTQRSFVEMAEKGYVHRDEHPVNWCPRCETAIADAEVENVDTEGTLSTVRFSGIDNDAIEIATTRPELLAACVGMAVDPDDERYADRIGDTFEVPLFGQEVELVASEEVDGDFGTGAVMICTFGDKQDVDWWAEYDLDLRPVVTEDGRLAEDVPEFGGLAIDDANEEISTALQREGYLRDEEPIEQSVGACWRCDTPIEILSKEQWFVRVDREEILDNAREVDWIPEHMYDRLEEWTEGMEWDWVISRQRVFATPIPAWSCDDCGHWHVAELDDLPAKPTEDDPDADCPECGADAWTGETDVMDTWMDSSISALHVAGWPDADFSPVQLREQGHDIIRTWAFYTLLRTAALEDQRPWDEALINGMVLGTDGNKMSKSKDNSVAPIDVVEDHSADAFRQALALGGQPGSDIQFQPKEVTSASRFLTKLWNITRFASQHLDTESHGSVADEGAFDEAATDADRWILSRCARVADDVAADMNEYRFDRALRKVREFVWHDLADDYVELIKGRLYEGNDTERDAARHALSTTLSASLRMLAPFSPFLAEEAYHHLPDTSGSVHAATWPALDIADDAAEARGERIAAVASAVRAWKSDEGMALNADLARIEVYADGIAELDTGDLSATVNAPVTVETGEPDVEMVAVGVDPDHSTIGPEFRDRAGAVVGALEATDPTAVERQKNENGTIELDVEGETVTLDGDAVAVEREQRVAGEEVAVLDAEGATVLVFP